VVEPKVLYYATSAWSRVFGNLWWLITCRYVLTFVTIALGGREESTVCIIRRFGTIQAECLSLNAHFYVVDPLKYDIYFDVNFARELWLFVVTVRKPGTD
jgi:hypothetical protein